MRTETLKGSSDAVDWEAARGEKWRAHIAPLEKMLAPIDVPLLDALRLDTPLRIADLGCGGGGTSLEVAGRAPLGTVVVGVDISSALIEAARARVPANDPGIRFTVADIAKAPPPGGAYERLVSRFGLLFFEDPQAAFHNLATWLVPGGRFAFAVWGPASDNPWLEIGRGVVAQHIELPRSAPGGPGPYRYAATDELLALLDRAAFTALDVCEWRGELALGGGLPAEDASTFSLSAFAFADPVARADGATQAKIHRTLSERFADHLTGGVVRLGARVHIVTGGR